MSGKEILVDTNIILYLLKGNDTLEDLLQGKSLHVSFITELELIGFNNFSFLEIYFLLKRTDEFQVMPVFLDGKKVIIAPFR